MNKIFSNPAFISLMDTYGDMTGFITLDKCLANAKLGIMDTNALTNAVNTVVALTNKYNLFNLGIIDQNDLYMMGLVTSGMLYTNDAKDQTLLSNIVKFGDAINAANNVAGYALNMIFGK